MTIPGFPLSTNRQKGPSHYPEEKKKRKKGVSCQSFSNKIIRPVQLARAIGKPCLDVMPCYSRGGGLLGLRTGTTNNHSYPVIVSHY